MLSALHVSQARDVRRLREQAGRAPSPRYRRIGTRSVAVALVGLLVLGGAAAYGVTQLIGDDRGERFRQRAGEQRKPKRKRAAVKPGNVTVAVLNGTTVPGLAAALRDEIAAAGFKKGVIDVYSDQQLADVGRPVRARTPGRGEGGQPQRRDQPA